MDKEVDTEKRYCKKCNTEIPSKRRKVFCSVKCAKAYHSLKRYHKIKSTPEYKERRKEYMKEKRKEEEKETEQKKE